MRHTAKCDYDAARNPFGGCWLEFAQGIGALVAVMASLVAAALLWQGVVALSG